MENKVYILEDEKTLTGKKNIHVKDFFKIVNNTEFDYKIIRINTSCGCTTVDNYNDTIIKSYTKTTIDFQINMENESSKYIWVKIDSVTNEEDNEETLSFKINRHIIE
jgi:phosphopantetheine adenylyltransferase